MIREIKDELCRIGEKVNKEQLFELSPVYLLTNHADNCKYIQHLLNGLRFGLEEKRLISSKSDIFLCYSLTYNSQELQLGLYDESGVFKISLERWLSYINMKYHFERGIIMINIEHFKDIAQDCLWWKQFFSDINKYKKHYLFFISCYPIDITVIQRLFEKEVFTMRYDVDGFTAEDYFNWFIVKLDEYSVFLDKSGKTELKRLFIKYENDIDHHILELWLKSLLWSYYSNQNGYVFLSLDYLSEDLLSQIINKCKKNDALKIGFI